VSSFEEFVRATGRRMHQSALLLCGGDHHLAEDLTQATYAKVFAAWPRVEAADDPVAYTRVVLTRTYLSHRRLGRNTERPSDTLPDRAAPTEGDLALRHDLLDAIRLLKPRDRALLVLRYWEDRSVRETADLLGLSEATVRQRSRRALTTLRTRLPELELIDPTDTLAPNTES
jgi:RNA polymerase sigma-70 factor (sigma-E family)